MYRTAHFRIKKGHKLHKYCRETTSGSANLYNRGNFVIRQYATALKSFSEMKPLYKNQIEIYNLVVDVLKGTKYESANKWLSYGQLDYILKKTKDDAYYGVPSQSNQQTLKLLMRDYTSFFEALKKYNSDPASMTGRPKMPGYIKDGGLKTAILTNQICCIKDSKYLKFPGVKTRLNLGNVQKDAKLKEVRIKPCGDSFDVGVVFDVPDAGISPEDDAAVLEELKTKTDISDIRVFSIDTGLNALFAVTNNFGLQPFVIHGGLVKSINRKYNKDLAKYKSAAMMCNGRKTTKKICKTTQKRNREIKDFFHKASRIITDCAVENHVGLVIMGHNPYQKQEINLGHVNNQNFVQIPFKVLADMLRYKLNEAGIRFVLVEESYTSKADFLAGDAIPVYGHEDEKCAFSGKRNGRWYEHYDGTLSHSDINGAANIMRKVFPEISQWGRGIVDMPCSLDWWKNHQSKGQCRFAA